MWVDRLSCACCDDCFKELRWTGDDHRANGGPVCKDCHPLGFNALPLAQTAAIRAEWSRMALELLALAGGLGMVLAFVAVFLGG